MVKNFQDRQFKGEKYYEQIVKAAKVVIVRFDKDSRITDFSGSSEKVFGFAKEEVIGRFLTDTIVPVRESSGRNLKKLLKSIVTNAGGYQYNINENITKDGRRIWMQWYNSEIFNESDEPDGVLSIGVEITDKIEAERKLKQSEERFRMLSELTFEGIIIHDNGIILDCNLSFERQIGYSYEELVGMDLFSLLIPEKYHRTMKSKIREKEITYEAEAIHKSGRLIPIMIEARDTLINDRKVRVMAIRDISQQKLMNEVLKRAHTELSTLKKVGHDVNKSLTLSQVTNAAMEGIRNVVNPDVVMILLKAGNEIMVNDSLKSDHYKGEIPIPEIKDPGIYFGKWFHSIDAAKVMNDDWKNFLDAGIRYITLLPLMQGEDALGIIILGSAKKRNIRKSQVFIETIAHETSIGIQNAILYEQVRSHAEELEIQVKQRTKELHHSIERLTEMDKLKSIFLASMSHELRTPLNSIIGYTGILLMGMTGDMTEEQKKQLGKVKNNARHLLSLINDILDISKIEAGKAELYIEDVKLDDILKEVTDTILPKAMEKGIAINSLTDEHLVIKTDQRRLTQVVLNLASNAVNYTDKGKVEIKVKTTGNGRFRLSVIDTGPGIDQENLNRLFQPFQQIDASLTKKNKGTGLGLYLCRKLMDLLGGEVNVHSKPGKGSEFYIEMALKPSDL